MPKADEDWIAYLMSGAGDYLRNSYDRAARGLRSIPDAAQHYATEYGRPAVEFAASVIPGAGLVQGNQDFERGRKALGEGRYGQAAVDYLTGAGNVGLEAIPGGALAGKMAPAILAGVGARRAPLDKLRTAFDMEKAGASADDIWQTAGWERGADGKWRFEIPDTNSSINQQAQDELQRYNTVVLGDLLNHPELYDAYPDLARLPVVPDHGSGGGYAGSSIRIGVDEPNIRGTLLHEGQHGVQGVEGFAAGANPDHVQKTISRGLSDAIARSASPEEAAALQAIKSRPYNAAYDAYRATAGEVEARNVGETRADMAPDELKARRPGDTEDQKYSRDRQIIPNYDGLYPNPMTVNGKYAVNMQKSSSAQPIKLKSIDISTDGNIKSEGHSRSPSIVTYVSHGDTPETIIDNIKANYSIDVPFPRDAAYADGGELENMLNDPSFIEQISKKLEEAKRRGLMPGPNDEDGGFSLVISADRSPTSTWSQYFGENVSPDKKNELDMAAGEDFYRRAKAASMDAAYKEYLAAGGTPTTPKARAEWDKKNPGRQYTSLDFDPASWTWREKLRFDRDPKTGEMVPVRAPLK